MGRGGRRGRANASLGDAGRGWQFAPSELYSASGCPPAWGFASKLPHCRRAGCAPARVPVAPCAPPPPPPSGAHAAPCRHAPSAQPAPMRHATTSVPAATRRSMHGGRKPRPRRAIVVSVVVPQAEEARAGAGPPRWGSNRMGNAHAWRCGAKIEVPVRARVSLDAPAGLWQPSARSNDARAGRGKAVAWPGRGPRWLHGLGEGLFRREHAWEGGRSRHAQRPCAGTSMS